MDDKLKLHLKNTAAKHNGSDFEAIIKGGCDFYRVRGMADIEKNQEPMRIIKNMGDGKFLCAFASKSRADFMGFMPGGRAVYFEAKYTDTGRMEQSRVTPDQTNRLERAYQYGALAFVCCCFGMVAFYSVPWDVWRAMKELYGRKYVTPRDIERYRLHISPTGALMFLDPLAENGV